TRALFSQPTVWVYDVSTYSLVWFSFIAAAFVLKEKKHLSVDLLISMATPRVKAASELLSLVLMLVFIGFMLVYSYLDMAHAFASGELEPTIIRTPTYLVLAGMVLGLLIFIVQIVRDLFRVLAEWAS